LSRSAREFSIVLTFLGVTAIINIALGYVLAVYLGHARAAAAPPISMAAAAHGPPQATAELQTVARPVARREALPTEVKQPNATEVAGWGDAFLASGEPPAGSDRETPAADIMMRTSAAEGESSVTARLAGDVPTGEIAVLARSESTPDAVEQELLAGIEEFRNQLAQMKDGAVPAAADPRPAAATSV
jgi:hypothetical protein